MAAEASAVETTAFTANWNAVEEATGYTLEVRERNMTSPEENLQLSEDFSGFADVQKDGSADISAQLDDRMKHTGWTGTKLYASPSRIKMGSSKQAGTLVTPLLDVPSTGSVTVRVDEDTYGTVESTGMDIRLLSSGGTQLQSQSLTVSGGTYVIRFEGVETPYRIGFYPQKRIYVAGVEVYDGDYSEEDLSAAPARRAKASVRLIEDIAGTSYRVEGLTPGATYAYRVKAVTAEGESAWSNAVTVSLPAGTGIAGAVSGTDGAVEVFSTDGRLLRRIQSGTANSGNHTWSAGLPAGTYIVRQSGTTNKLIVK